MTAFRKAGSGQGNTSRETAKKLTIACAQVRLYNSIEAVEEAVAFFLLANEYPLEEYFRNKYIKNCRYRVNV